MKKIILVSIIIILLISQNVFASSDDWWGAAINFFDGTYERADLGALNSLTNLIKVVGNMAFFAATVILGVKYIWGSVESKSSIKNSLISLITAAVFFYGYTTIETLFVQSDGLIFISDDVEDTAANIYNLILYVCNFFAIGGIVYIGIKYLMAGAQGKAELKTKSVPAILGIIMVYSTLGFLTFIVSIFV